jgi:MFS family permease
MPEAADAAEATADAGEPTADGHRGTALLIVGLAMAVTTLSLLQTLVVPVMSTIAAQLDASLTAVGWVLTANLLSAAVLTPVLGRMGDVYGKRRVMLGILGLILAGTVLALVTTSLPVLIFARVLQGASYGLFPLSMGVLRDSIPSNRLPQSMAMVSATLGVGGVIGLLGAGLLTRGGGDYHRPFWVGLVFTVVALVICYLTLPKAAPTAARPSTSVDWLGAVILGVGLVLLLLPIAEGEDWGWGSPATIGCFIGALVVLAGWLVAEGRIKQPLARPALLSARGVMIPNLVGLCTGFGLYAAFLGITDFVESPTHPAGYGFTASVLAASAVYLLPGGVLGVIAAPFIGQFVHRVGAYPAMVLGGSAGFIGFIGLTVLHSRTWMWIVLGSLVQLAVTFGFATLPAALIGSVAPADTGVANSVNSIARSVGSAVASALIVAVLTGNISKATGLPSESAFELILILGAAAFALVIVLGLAGRWLVTGPHASPREPEVEAEDLAGEFSPVSGLN